MGLVLNNSTVEVNDRESYSTYHLARHPELYEVQRTNNFEFIVTDLEGLTKVGEGVNTSPNFTTDGSLAGSGLGANSNVLRIAVSSSSVPHFSQDAIEVKRGNNTLKYAGTPKFDSHTVKFYDYIGADAKEILMAWQAKSYNTTTQKVGIASDYKKDCYLKEYTPDWQLVRSWILHGCWIGAIQEDEYDSDSNNVKKINCTINYDWAEIDYSGA